MRALRATLRVAEFRALLGSYVINRAGDVVGALALAVIVLGATGSPVATAALFLATQFVPGMIGPSLVARIGALPAGRLLPRLYVVEGILFLSMALAARHIPVAGLISLAWLDATLAFCARSVTRAATATTLLPSGLMPEGKAAFNMALAGATVSGPVLGGALLAGLGPSAALSADAASFLLAALLVARSSGLRVSGAPDGAQAGRHTAGGIRATLSYIARDRALSALVFGEGIAFVFFYLVVPVTVVYATHSLHAGSSGYAAILASWGVGMATGSVLLVRLARRSRSLILLSTLAVAAGYLGTALAPSLAVACAASVVGGVGNGTQWAAVETAVHAAIEERFRVRVTAVLEALAALAPGVGIVVGGALTTLFSPRAAYLAAGLGLVGLVTVGGLSQRSRGPRTGTSAQTCVVPS